MIRIVDEIAQLSEQRLTKVFLERAQKVVQENICSERGCDKPCPKAQIAMLRLLSVFWEVYVEGN